MPVVLVHPFVPLAVVPVPILQQEHRYACNVRQGQFLPVVELHAHNVQVPSRVMPHPS